MTTFCLFQSSVFEKFRHFQTLDIRHTYTAFRYLSTVSDFGMLPVMLRYAAGHVITHKLGILHNQANDTGQT